jgi:hypothetical protein
VQHRSRAVFATSKPSLTFMAHRSRRPGSLRPARRGASSKPASRRSAKRRSHRPTWCSPMPTSTAIRRLVIPSTADSTIPSHSRKRCGRLCCAMPTRDTLKRRSRARPDSSRSAIEHDFSRRPTGLDLHLHLAVPSADVLHQRMPAMITWRNKVSPPAGAGAGPGTRITAA